MKHQNKIPAEDRQLMDAVAAQDENALRLLIGKFRPMVFKTAAGIVCDAPEAEDITQEVFIKVWKQAHRFNDRYRLSTWLYRITCNLSVDHLRRKKFPVSVFSRYSSTGHLEKAAAGPPEKSSEELMIESEEWNIFMEASRRLSPKQRAVFTLKELEGLDTEEVSRITGMSADQIKSNLYLARKAIKERLSKQ